MKRVDKTNYEILKEISDKAGEKLIRFIEKDAFTPEDINAMTLLSGIVIHINNKFRLESSMRPDIKNSAQE